MSQPIAGTVYRAVPGPSDRVHFEWMQARQRRAARAYAAIGALAVAAAGVPVSLVVTPLLFLIASIAIRLVSVLVAVPVPAFAQEIDQAVRASLAMVMAFQWPTIDRRVAMFLFLPGAVAMIVLWLGVLRPLARAGAGGTLLALGIRDRTSADFEEHQLQNTVDEMAIAAGAQPPVVRLLDVSAANAAAIGTGNSNATIVVTRGLLDRLNRDETQAVIGHLVASIGNGDLGVATMLLSIQQTLGLLTAVLNAPFGPQSRRLLGRLFRPRGTDESAIVAELLAGAALETEDDVARRVSKVGRRGLALHLLVVVPIFPVLFVALSARLATVLVLGGLFGPVFAAIWRRRRRMADAMAVQLTRNPDALARALASLTAVEHHVPGGLGAAHLFVVWQPDHSGHYLSRVFGGLGTLAPSISRRREGLRRMGATSVAMARRNWGWRDLVREPSRTIILTLPPLVLLSAYAAVVTLGAIITFNFLFLGLLLLGMNGLIDLAIGMIGRLLA